MYDMADSILAQKISQISGVGQVNIGGSSQPAVRVEVNPLLLSKLGVSLDQVRIALEQANANVPKGSLADQDRRFVLDDNDQLFVAREYAPLIVAYHNGAPVRLSDVARVVDNQLNRLNAGTVNGKPSVLIQIYKQPAANTITTSDRVLDLLPFLQATSSPRPIPFRLPTACWGSCLFCKHPSPLPSESAFRRTAPPPFALPFTISR